METVKIHFLDCGIIHTRLSIVIESAGENEMVESPIPAVLIQHPVLGNILYDTGNPIEGSAIMGMRGNDFDFQKINPITECLKKFNLTVDDIDYVILSHLHMDHAGGLRYFANTKAAARGIIAHEEELRHSFYVVNVLDDPGFYAEPLITDIPGMKWFPMTGTLNLSEDITIFSQEAHTPGVLGLMVKTKSHGNVAIVGDACYTKRNFDELTPPGGLSKEEREKFYDNVVYLKELQQKYQAKLVFGHDKEQLTKLFGVVID